MRSAIELGLGVIALILLLGEEPRGQIVGALMLAVVCLVNIERDRRS